MQADGEIGGGVLQVHWNLLTRTLSCGKSKCCLFFLFQGWGYFFKRELFFRNFLMLAMVLYYPSGFRLWPVLSYDNLDFNF